MANDYSWVPELGKNVGNMLGLDPRAKAEGKLMQGKADLQDMELKHKPILYTAQAGNQNAQGRYHNARAGGVEDENAAKRDFGNNIRKALVQDKVTGAVHVDVNMLADLLSAHPYAPKAMAGLGDSLASLNRQVGPQYKEEMVETWDEEGATAPTPTPTMTPTGKFIQTAPAQSLQPAAQLRSPDGAANARVLSDPNLSVTPEGKANILADKTDRALAVQGSKNEGTVAAAIARSATPRAGASTGPKSTDVVNSGKWIEEAETAIVQMFAGGEAMDPQTARELAVAAYKDRFGDGLPNENASVVISDFVKKNGLTGAQKEFNFWSKNTMGVKRAADEGNKILGPSDISSLVSGGSAPPKAPVAPAASVKPQAQSPVANAIAPPMDQGAPAAPPSPFGLRKDGTPKGPGFIQLQGKDGSVMTEVTVGVPINGVETEIPTLVPGLSEAEKQYLQDGGDPRKSPSIMTKAIAHAGQRMNQKKSVFVEDGEVPPQAAKPPANIPAPEQRVDGHIYEIPGKGKYKWNASTQKWSPA